jgi:diguanylate cyclase (GGDEF)-like protein
MSVETLASVTEAERLRIALTAAGDLVYDWTPADGNIHWIGDPAEKLGFPCPQVFEMERRFRTLIDADGVKARASLIHAPQGGDQPFSFQYRLNREDGQPVWVEDRGACFVGQDGKTERVIGVLRDITLAKRREERLAQAAHFDEMTGHFTRGRLKDHLALHMAQCETRPGATVGYCVAAIDELAVVNEIYGIDAADEAIAAVGQMLAAIAGDDAIIGRTAGNKFGIILPDCKPEDLDRRAGALRSSVRDRALRTRSGVVSGTISVGAILLPADADSAPLAMARAEEALDRAKTQGRNGYAVYVHSAQRESVRRKTVSVGDQILSALSDDRVCIAYQPIFEAKSGKVASYECLARIVNPDGELLGAGEFIPVAEQLGLVQLIDRRILELSLDTLHRCPDVKLALNVSGMTASDRMALEAFASTLEHNAAVAPRLIVELTETAALLDIEESVRFTARLREMGAGVAIDDFGAGYTSFRNLQALRVDMVKIDGSFVRGLAQSRDNQVFVRTLVDLARNFRLETVAEWVSDQHEADILNAVGVDYLQGFFLGKPEINPDWLK